MPVQQHDTMTPGLAAAIPPASAVNSPPQVEARSSLSPLSAALPLWLWPVAIVLAMLGLATANPMLTAVGILAVPLLVFGAGSLSDGATSGIALTAAVSLALLAIAPLAAAAAVRSARG